MSEKSKKKGFYLPTIILGLIVTAIFLLAIFTYQVPATERALVLRMGKIVSPEEGVMPGLHFRWPLPFEEVIKYDVRLRTFDGKIGKYEESTTRDKRQVVIGINVFYRIKNLNQFKTAASLEAAEDGVLEVQRNDLAQRFNCVPSQINYVMSTRFSPERGYIVESRRGGN